MNVFKIIGIVGAIGTIATGLIIFAKGRKELNDYMNNIDPEWFYGRNV